MKEVARLLRSSRAMRLRMSAEASEADFERSKQVRDVQALFVVLLIHPQFRCSTCTFCCVITTPFVCCMWQKQLQVMCIRAMALGIGRGMLTLGTQHSALTETMPIPALELSARMPPNNAKVQLDTAGQISP